MCAILTQGGEDVLRLGYVVILLMARCVCVKKFWGIAINRIFERESFPPRHPFPASNPPAVAPCQPASLLTSQLANQQGRWPRSLRASKCAVSQASQQASQLLASKSQRM